jgi:hypothetical protein
MFRRGRRTPRRRGTRNHAPWPPAQPPHGRDGRRARLVRGRETEREGVRRAPCALARAAVRVTATCSELLSTVTRQSQCSVPILTPEPSLSVAMIQLCMCLISLISTTRNGTLSTIDSVVNSVVNAPPLASRARPSSCVFCSFRDTHRQTLHFPFIYYYACSVGTC